MAETDVVIVEPIEMNSKYSSFAQQKETKMLSYINSSEADRWNTDFYTQLNEEDFYQLKLSSPHTQEILMHAIEKRVIKAGYGGVFLDTVGNIEDYLPKDEQKKEMEALQSLIHLIKEKHPSLIIGQNWGFDMLENYTASSIDYFLVCAENTREFSHEWFN